MPAPSFAAPILYRIVPKDPAAHLFEITLTVDRPDSAGQRFALPAWIPGSYMIREFARHIVAISATADGKAVALNKLDKHTWQVEPCPGTVRRMTLIYEVYAWDLSVRGAHLDSTHGFFNGTSVFLRVLGRETSPCEVEIRPPAGAGYRDWRVATSLPTATGRGAAVPWAFGRYRAADYDELIDHPVEMGRFSLVSFKAAGVVHDIVITGRHTADMERLARDLKRVCESQIRLFHGERGKPPFARYVFLVTAVGEGYGGLEHRASTALICSRHELPAAGVAKIGDAYRQFLGLCSHEYFHAWNIKRIKPAAFIPYDLERENYTPLLWAFEGFTSYYDDLMLVRSGVISAQEYLDLVAKAVTGVYRASGRKRQSVAESSFDAWIKYYRQDENSPNAIVSYYAKGSLVALGLDLSLRRETRGRVSLDDVMRALWQEYGATGVGVEADSIRQCAERISGLSLKPLFDAWVHGTEDLPLTEMLERFAVELRWEANGAQVPGLGARTAVESGELRLATVYGGGPAHAAGLSAHDVLVAIDGLRVTRDNLDRLLGRYTAGTAVCVHAFRRDELMQFQVTLSAAPADNCRLVLKSKALASALRLRKAWLGA